jgi:uncharacterized protein
MKISSTISPLLGVALVVLAQAATAQSAAATAKPLGASAALNHGATAAPELKELPGVTSWKLLAQVKTTQQNKRFVTEFAPSILALNRKTIKLQGFMMPLGPADMQSHFLLTLTPQSCLFCLPAGPEGMVEVTLKKPMKITFDALVVSGVFDTIQDDKNGLLYRLSAAVVSQ